MMICLFCKANLCVLQKLGKAFLRLFLKGLLWICIVPLSVTTLFAQGVGQREILLGGHLPLSGGLQAVGDVAKGADAYFQYINEQGGVHGRLIRYQYQDDRFQPEVAKQVVSRLVLDEQVFAMFGSVESGVGTELTGWISQMEVPNLFLVSRTAEFLKYPLTSAFMPTLKTESAILGRYLATQSPRSNVLIWSRQDNYHQTLTRLLVKELKKGQIPVQVLTHEKFLQTFHAESVKIEEAEADILVIFSTPAVSHQIISKLKKNKPSQIYLGYDATFPKPIETTSAKTILTLGNLPFASHLENKGIQLHHRLLQAYFPKTEPNQWTIYGHVAAESMVALLHQVGRDLNRQAFLKQAYSFQHKSSTIAPPIHATKTLHWVRSMRIAQLKNGSFVFISPWIQAL